jgi:Cu-Zn family superoxide dismutase
MIKPSSAATTQPANNNVTGTVTFVQTGSDTIKVVVDLTGLAPNTKHGFHIHEKGDLSDPQLMSAGAHFNPAGHKHGGPDSPMAHAGDLGNVTADSNGNVRTEMTVKGISLDKDSPNNIVGRSVLVHAKEDDLKTDPSGNSGGRVAGGVIEMAK